MALFIPKIIYGTGLTEIEFDYPVKGPNSLASKIKAVGKVSESAGGQTQTVVNYMKKEYNFTFSFLSETKRAEVETFLTTHGFLGKEFDYYFDKDEVSFATVTIDKSSREADFKSLLFKPSDDNFIYEIKLKFRRVI